MSRTAKEYRHDAARNLKLAVKADDVGLKRDARALRREAHDWIRQAEIIESGVKQRQKDGL